MSDIVVSLACIILSFYMSWKLTLALLATLPVSFFILAWISRPLEPAIRAQKSHLTEASKFTNSSFTGIDLVKVYNGFNQEVWQYTKAIRASMAQYLIQARCNSMQMGYAKFWIVSLFVVGFWYGIVLVDRGASAFQILTTFYATLTALQGIENLMPQWLVLAKGMSAGQALQDTIRSGSSRFGNTGHKGPNKPSECAGDIEVVNASITAPHIMYSANMCVNRLALPTRRALTILSLKSRPSSSQPARLASSWAAAAQAKALSAIFSSSSTSP